MKSNQTYGQVELSIDGLGTKRITSKANSNVFSSSKGFGKYKYNSKFSEEIKRLKKIEKRISELNQTMTLSGKSLNDVFPVKRHEFYIEFKGYTLSSKNPFFKDVKEIIEDIFMSKKKEIIMEVNLIDSQLTITNKKNKKTSIFNKEENCSGSEASGICKIKELGFISI